MSIREKYKGHWFQGVKPNTWQGDNFQIGGPKVPWSQWQQNGGWDQNQTPLPEAPTPTTQDPGPGGVFGSGMTMDQITAQLRGVLGTDELLAAIKNQYQQGPNSQQPAGGPQDHMTEAPGGGIVPPGRVPPNITQAEVWGKVPTPTTPPVSPPVSQPTPPVRPNISAPTNPVREPVFTTQPTPPRVPSPTILPPSVLDLPLPPVKVDLPAVLPRVQKPTTKTTKPKKPNKTPRSRGGPSVVRGRMR